MSDRNFLKNLKAGDFVFIKRAGLGEGMSCVKIEKITPKRGDIIAGGVTFRSDGYSKGSCFNYSYLVEYNQENINQFKNLKLKKEVLEILNHLKSRLENGLLSIDEMQKISDLKNIV